MAFKRIAGVGDVPAGKAKKIDVDGKSLALFNAGGKLYCTDNKCTHKGGPLCDGELKGTEVTCPWHGSKFDVATGAVKAGPAKDKIVVYKVKVQGKDVLADL